MNFRNLNPNEIQQLESQGCICENWDKVLVDFDFNPSRVNRVEMSGNIRLGAFRRKFIRPGGLRRSSGVSDVTLHNVSVGDDAYIHRVAESIANYDIADNAYLENVDCIVGTLDSTFGVGTEVSVLNETGGREVPVYDELSAQTAYLVAMYRHKPEMVSRLVTMVKIHADTLRGRRGRIGSHAEIVNSGNITNVMIGDYAVIEGATRLSNGTIVSNSEDKVTVGRNVIAEGFIFASGSKIDAGAVIHHCFIGQATTLTHLFSAHDSLFFSNCACENGEAAAIFGGPYTVTMHKSSLLIAGMFSFLNAGSGSNQSNHMYKLGPIHQGVVERGSKTTSDSYILWPAKIGAFSLVMGRHVTHPDTSRLPFSYLIESHGQSFLVPGVNLRSVGTIRDAQKWPRRDKRKDSCKLDSINFNLLSPYTVGKMMDGIALLDALESTAGLTAERFSYQAMTIEARALRQGRKYYRMAIDKFMGNSIIHRLRDVVLTSDSQLREILTPTHPAGRGMWVDISGMFAPKSEVDRICNAVAEGEIDSLDTLEQQWRRLHADYYSMEWTWVAEHIEMWYGKPWDALTLADIRDIVDRWIHSVTELDMMLREDARKEYSLTSRTGFGVDGASGDAAIDFSTVRGDYERDPFVKMVEKHIVDKTALADDLRSRIR